MDPETHRQCSKCRQTKPIDEYHWRKDRHCYRRDCKLCVNTARSERGKQAYQADPAYHNTRCARWEQENKVRRKLRKHQYYLEHKETILTRNQAWIKQRMKDDMGFKLASRMRSRMAAVLRKIDSRKADCSLKLIGCTAFELKVHLEGLFKEGMRWDMLGVGPGSFQIDHIVPLGLFDLTDPEQQRKAFHYTNLQPLWYEDHVAKTAVDIVRIRYATKHRQRTDEPLAHQPELSLD